MNYPPFAYLIAQEDTGAAVQSLSAIGTPRMCVLMCVYWGMCQFLQLCGSVCLFPRDD